MPHKPAICGVCRDFEHDAPRKEPASLVRCMLEDNWEGIWFQLVKYGQLACRAFRLAGQSGDRT